MRVSDYIVEFFINKNITDVFGYPGGMVTYLMDSFDKHSDRIKAHVNYHEQASSFCACGYAQASNVPGVAYATSGPGATNLITGIANAFFDSIPCIFITGQVNTNESKKNLNVRQKGFQETNIVNIVSSITKYAVYIDDADMIRYELEKAYDICISGRPGPVLLDIPINIFRSNIDLDNVKSYECCSKSINSNEKLDNKNVLEICNIILKSVQQAKKPVLLLGNGVNISNTKMLVNRFINSIKIPVVTSMISVDILDKKSDYNFGFIGAYGHRVANLILSKSDLILSLGSRLDGRQTGSNLKVFGDHQIIRIDIDEDELNNKINKNEIDFKIDLKILLEALNNAICNYNIDKSDWMSKCKEIQLRLINRDKLAPNNIVEEISKLIPDDYIITTDVGQNQVWIAQSFYVKHNQRIIFSGGHGAMGYSLPAAIGAYFATKKNIVCFTGDGGLQMNIQELQFIKREKIPIKIILINNHSLGMIRHFQEMYFESNYTQTISEKGYLAPNFKDICNAYDINYFKIDFTDDISQIQSLISSSQACFLEIELLQNTYVLPKLEVNKPMYDQYPNLDKDILNKLLNILEE